MVEDENNFDEVQDAFEEGLQEGLALLYSDTLETLDENMRQGKDALGREWRPVTQETLQSRQVRTDDPAALLDSGELRASIQSDSELNLRELEAVIGSSKEFLVYHEMGAPEAGIPRRPVLGPAATYAENQVDETIGVEIDTRLQEAEL